MPDSFALNVPGFALKTHLGIVVGGHVLVVLRPGNENNVGLRPGIENNTAMMIGAVPRGAAEALDTTV